MTGLWPEGSGGKVLKFDGAFAPKVLRFDSPFGLRDEYKVNVTGISSLCFRHPKHGGELATSGGFFPPWCLFFLARRAVVRFSHGRSPVLKVFYKLAAKPPTTTLAARKAASNLSPFRTFGPKGRQPSRPKGRVHKGAHHNPRGQRPRQT